MDTDIVLLPRNTPRNALERLNKCRIGSQEKSADNGSNHGSDHRSVILPSDA